MKKTSHKTIPVFDETKKRIQQLKLDWGCRTEEEVVQILLDYYNANNDPIILQAIKLIRDIKNQLMNQS